MTAVNPATGELVEEVTGATGEPVVPLSQYVELEQQLRAIELKLRASALNEARLKAELERQRVESPEGRVAKALGKYWIAACKKRKTTKVKEKRLKAVLDRLRDGYDPEYIARAIDGAAVAANTASSETERLALIKVMQQAIRRVDEPTAKELRDVYRESMQNVTRYDDLELICRDETKLERFHDLAERVNAPSLMGPAWLREFGPPEGDSKTPDVLD